MAPDAPPPLPDIHHGSIVPVLERVEQTRLARRVRQLLVHWRGEPASSVTWEDLDDFRQQYPTFQLEDELDLEGGEMSCGAARTHVSGGPETSGEPQRARQQRAEARPVARPDRVAKGWP
jgi:hypothetical protein